MSRYLIDTNILSEPLKPKPNDRVIALMKQHSEQIAISTITWHEILFGFYRLPSSRRKETIERYIRSVKATFPILPYTIESADWQALERARLSKIGQSPSFPDSQIAAIAAVNDLILVTNNVSDYQNFQGVLIENWFTVSQ
ncbi:type II toxin-antitoxin system VapC family toxin [Acaryochloris marina]|uniref:type II toxin-antitoxin system VapC family toxin n=1 Tax=Acaryochloris marina TaxID=155978 RepID=UPI0021C26FDD|nr:type II toxin-antitoxin system VapC family toxin [Acaryochloris marina]BDM83916.1 ribonuclease VapC [Acaryochloris marina MBIC10699]